MKNNQFSHRWILLMVLAVFVTGACNLFSNALPVDEIVSEIEDMATQADVENLEELQENLETMMPELPEDLDLEGLQLTAEAFQEDFQLGEAPPDIPVVEGQAEDLFASEAFVSYTTPMEFDEVLAFYQDEMPKNGWESDEDGSFVLEGTALLSFVKDGRMAIVTISSGATDGTTAVLITLQTE